MTKQKFLWLIEKNYPLLLRVATRLLNGDVPTAQDSVQEVIARVLERKSYLNGEGSNKRLQGWLIRVVKNQTIDQLRRKQGMELSAMTEAVEIDVTRTQFSGTRTFYPSEPQEDGHGVGPAVALPRPIRREPDAIRFDVSRALAKLSARHRYIAEGCLIGVDTPETMAEDLDTYPAEIKKQLAWIVDFLQEELGQYKVGKLQVKSG